METKTFNIKTAFSETMEGTREALPTPTTLKEEMDHHLDHVDSSGSDLMFLLGFMDLLQRQERDKGPVQEEAQRRQRQELIGSYGEVLHLLPEEGEEIIKGTHKRTVVAWVRDFLLLAAFEQPGMLEVLEMVRGNPAPFWSGIAVAKERYDREPPGGSLVYQTILRGLADLA